MKKVNSAASYSEFRKKNPSVKEPTPKETNTIQIEQLAKQLEAINLKKPSVKKYEHPNGIIQEEEQDQLIHANQTNSANKPKPYSIAAKKLKAITNKVQPMVTKFQPHKMNKSINEAPIFAKKQLPIILKDSSAKNLSNANVKIVTKKEQKQKDPKSGRRMSLNALGKSSPLSMNKSLNTTISQSQNSMAMSRKKEVMDKIMEIEAKIDKKSIPAHLFQQIMDKIQKIQQILQEC